MIQVGDFFPDVTLTDYVESEAEGCAIGPRAFNARSELANKKVVVFAVPGAFTPTCSEKHLPGYLDALDKLSELGVDEVWCVSVNDAFVMSAWGKAAGVAGRIRMLADGSADLTRAAGMVLDLSAKGLGIRSQRYSMCVNDGKVEVLNLDAGGKLERSDAATMLEQIAPKN